MKILAKIYLILCGMTLFYFVAVIMKCWTPECAQQPLHLDLAVITVLFGLFGLALRIVMFPPQH